VQITTGLVSRVREGIMCWHKVFVAIGVLLVSVSVRSEAGDADKGPAKEAKVKVEAGQRKFAAAYLNNNFILRFRQ
jgi:hypothetical protein